MDIYIYTCIFSYICLMKVLGNLRLNRDWIVNCVVLIFFTDMFMN